MGEVEKKRYLGDILQGVAHLHRHNIGHRDLSLENVLLRKGSAVLIDFGQAVMLKDSDGSVKRCSWLLTKPCCEVLCGGGQEDVPGPRSLRPSTARDTGARGKLKQF